ncbi:hypothetical protein B0J14DRAFT_550402 [Halenospora varia]|nr:hypothetical protein B0J14DRAFT_550402 [Halenospora varia]
MIELVSTTQFSRNFTFPPEGTRFVSAPNLRSTMSIIWSCLFTLFICTWAVQHLNVPPQDNIGWIRDFLRSSWEKLKWMLVSLFLPEFMMGKAMAKYAAAYASTHCPAMMSHDDRSGRKWTKTHTLYANMGGFVIKGEEGGQAAPKSTTDGQEENKIETASQTEGPTPAEPQTEAAWKSAVTGPKHVGKSDWGEASENVVLPDAVDSYQLCILLSTTFVSDWSISEDEIIDK